MTDDLLVPSYYVIDAEEAEACGLAAETWYAMPSLLGTLTVTHITRDLAAVQIIEHRDEHAEELVNWAVDQFLMLFFEPADWKPTARPD